MIFNILIHFQLSAIDYPNAKDLDQYLNRTGLMLEYNATFRSDINFNRSVIHVPTDVYDGGRFLKYYLSTCRSQLLC